MMEQAFDSSDSTLDPLYVHNDNDMIDSHQDHSDSFSYTSIVDNDNGEDPSASVTEEAAASLEGVLYWRKGRKSNHHSGTSSTSTSNKAGSFFFWQRRYVVLDLNQETMAAYSIHTNTNNNTKQKKRSPSKLHRNRSMYKNSINSNQSKEKNQLEKEQEQVLAYNWFIPSSAQWHVKDVANDSSTFVLEIMSPTHKDTSTCSLQEGERDEESSTSMISTSSNNSLNQNNQNQNHNQDNANHNNNTPSLRFYFKCRHGANEKLLWLKAFAKINRLSLQPRIKKPIILRHSPWKSPTFATNKSRTRTSSSAAFRRQSLQLDQQQQTIQPPRPNNNTHTTINSNSKETKRQKEYRVIPQRSYPNVWMTQQELNQEMEKPSLTFHDLQHNPCRLDLPKNPSKQPIIGTIHMEVLQGIALPKLKTDAVVYVVSGPYAFCTEVIKDKQSPIWPANSQRACSIPLHHAYARVFIGVFDDDNKKNKDDFHGRVVLDVARIRPNSTYDVTLPLRLSAHVYSKRQRGAIRLRFRLEWTSVRAALLSYLPDKKLPKPRNLKEFKPNTDTVVTCGSARAFRNVAITVHGAHLPGRFSFQQLRATIREINFTRRNVMEIVRNTIAEVRDWKNPLISAFCFLAWMHCVYQNAFSLVPAYVVLYFCILMVRNYARYGMDGPAQRGFIPPSWEELLAGLVLPQYYDQAIHPLEMRLTSTSAAQQHPTANGETNNGNNDDGVVQRVQIDTHQPRGKPLFQAMGFLDQPEPSDALQQQQQKQQEEGPNYHLEFPYADGRVYPRFDVEDSLATSQKRRRKNNNKASNRNSPVRSRGQRLKLRVSKILRKDTSGMNDYDDEEQRFATAKFIRQTGATQLMEAASGLMEVGETLGEATGLQYVVSPVVKGGHSAIKEGLHYVVPPIKSGIKTGHSAIETSIRGLNNHLVSPLVVSPLHHTVDLVRRTSNELFPLSHQQNIAPDDDGREEEEDGDDDDYELDDSRLLDELDERSALHYPYRQRHESELLVGDHGLMSSIAEMDVESDYDGEEGGAVIEGGEHGAAGASALRSDDSDDSTSPRRMQPDQDIDYGGQASNPKDKNRKRLTDDLQDVKDQMHQFTFQKFNDRAYIIRDSDSVYFGQSANATRRRKGQVKKDLNKLLQIGQYSHVNPVVGRVGQYVEPIVGASHSFLSAFRALFNVMTWRDPFLSFWISLLGFALVALLFVFPWRWFLFVLGLWFVGPQNLVYRVLRQKGILPPKKPRARPNREPEEMPVPMDQAVFQGHISQDQKRKPHKPVDPQEVQYVVVPYSPLMYQRFYDWPPEQEYSQVYSQNHVHPDFGATAAAVPNSLASNDYFSSSVAEGKKTR
ncbi:expressed unknown protein [Seminavis robusta]|uniref:C2 domain-containing protein n=1 Tax=Seminavis robusta TaxID=568900 RepID=A0A9N8DXG3_9STRA|nr:expressed unknown protein [Seminavis robusta]|eukprot:Sro428_g140920.1 n/a (1347) ;mRNA; r:50040-54171